MNSQQIPLSLYIHIPWCVRKCPYCDFNSHEAKNTLPEDAYIHALLDDLNQHSSLIQQRPLISIFFGGGTPSLFSAASIKKIIDGVAKHLAFNPNIEITLEANPGTIDQENFKGFRDAGINRLSLGIQSLQPEKLKALGRIHDRQQALQAITIAKEAGFTNFNLDIMYGLPDQTIDDALADIHDALQLQPTHFSWYQLTIEPNTYFYRHTPMLPTDDLIWEMQLAGQTLIRDHGFQQYEVSAYSLLQKQCSHNRNYWEFGDYLGIGAGAHSKITQDGRVIRFSQVKHPRDYLNAEKRVIKNMEVVSENDLIFEFMLNALRLSDGVSISLFTQRTGINLEKISSIIAKAKQRGLLVDDNNLLRPTELGKRFLNDLTSMFLLK